MSEVQFKKIQGLIQKGIDEGAFHTDVLAVGTVGTGAYFANAAPAGSRVRWRPKRRDGWRSRRCESCPRRSRPR